MQGRRVVVALVLVLWAGAARPARSQSATGLAGIPPEMYPPPNACRIWIDGVAPGRQPAPMDCAAAQRMVPANARVVYGVTALRAEEVAAGAGVDRRPVGGTDRRPPTLPAPEGPNDGPGSPTGCADGDRDGWCDQVRLPTRLPADLPRMTSALLYQRLGRGVRDVDQWLGGGRLQLRSVDANRDNVPERALWLDARGAPLQIWADTDGNGVADQIGVYRGRQLLRVVGTP